MPRVLVTGCAGFIGSNLVDALLRDNYKVIGLDCLTDFYSQKIKLANIESALRNKKFRFIRKDILDMNLKWLMEQNKISHIFHLAAQPGVTQSWDDFDSYVRNNITVTHRLLEACTEFEVKKFVFASSSSVYNSSFYGERPEPASPYGVTKLAAEKLCKNYYDSFGLRTVQLRYFSVYGPRQRPDQAICSFATRMLMKKSICLRGTGKQRRDFTYVDDIVDATIRAAKTHKKANGTALDIGNGYAVPLNDVVNMLKKETYFKGRILRHSTLPGEVEMTLADNSNAQRLLKWRPKVEIKDGIRRYVGWLRRMKDKSA